MRVNDPGKLVVLIVAIISAAVLLGFARVSEAAGVGIITYALGYLSGNGRLAMRGKSPSPTLGPTDHTDVDAGQADDDVDDGDWWTDGTDGPDT